MLVFFSVAVVFSVVVVAPGCVGAAAGWVEWVRSWTDCVTMVSTGPLIDCGDDGHHHREHQGGRRDRVPEAGIDVGGAEKCWHERDHDASTALWVMKRTEKKVMRNIRSGLPTLDTNQIIAVPAPAAPIPAEHGHAVETRNT